MFNAQPEPIFYIPLVVSNSSTSDYISATQDGLEDPYAEIMMVDRHIMTKAPINCWWWISFDIIVRNKYYICRAITADYPTDIKTWSCFLDTEHYALTNGFDKPQIINPKS